MSVTRKKKKVAVKINTNTIPPHPTDVPKRDHPLSPVGVMQQHKHGLISHSWKEQFRHPFCIHPEQVLLLTELGRFSMTFMEWWWRSSEILLSRKGWNWVPPEHSNTLRTQIGLNQNGFFNSKRFVVKYHIHPYSKGLPNWWYMLSMITKMKNSKGKEKGYKPWSSSSFSGRGYVTEHTLATSRARLNTSAAISALRRLPNTTVRATLHNIRKKKKRKK